MAEERIFVGRKDELEQFGKVLEDPKGQAVLVVGQAGMGKTWLVNKMAEVAENHAGLKCGWVRYEVTPTDSVDSTIALMMDNAFEAASTEPGSFDKVPERTKQWKALLNVIKIGDLVMSLRRDPAKNTREQFLERLRLISKRMPENGRAVFIIDPEKYMQKESDQSWAIVVKNLPEKIKFVFAQRPGDVLVDSETIGTLPNVVSIPEKRLDVLEEEAVDELLTQRIKGAKYTVTEIREVLSRYEGHPYALGAALDLIEGGIELEELPEKAEPTQFAAVQWRKVSKRSEDAIRLFKVYAILEVGVPNDVVEAVSEIDSNTRQHLVADKYLRGLLREEGEGKRIYHAILADYIVGQIGEGDKKEVHERAVEVYRKKLAEAEKNKTKPDALAAMRLAEHVLEAEGKEAFVVAFASECTKPLLNLGLFDATIDLCKRALEMVKKESKEEAMVTGTLGLVYDSRGSLDQAEEMFWSALSIDDKLGDNKGVAAQYGNLGVTYQKKGDYKKAQNMLMRALEINKSIEYKKGIIANWINLGLLYIEQGNSKKAENMFCKAQKICKDSGDEENMGAIYANVGLMYKRRNELDKAKNMFNKALHFYERVEHRENKAACYFNLSTIFGEMEDFDQAKIIMNKALKEYEELGIDKMIADCCALIGLFCSTSGEAYQGEQMVIRALKINENLGRHKEAAKNYENLGWIYTEGVLNDVEKTQKYWEKALELYKKIGMKTEVEKLQGLIESINK